MEFLLPNGRRVISQIQPQYVEYEGQIVEVKGVFVRPEVPNEHRLLLCESSREKPEQTGANRNKPAQTGTKRKKTQRR